MQRYLSRSGIIENMQSRTQSALCVTKSIVGLFYGIPNVIHGIENSTTWERGDVIDRSAIAKSAPPSSMGVKTSPIIPFQFPESGGDSDPYLKWKNI